MTDFAVSLILRDNDHLTVTMRDEFDKHEAMRRAVDKVIREQQLSPDRIRVVGCQEIDSEETPVIFRRSRRKEPAGLAAEVTAVFPCAPATTSDDGLMTCYAHMGQHGQCDQGWYNGTKAAKPDEYRALKAELESAPYGYRLKVYSRMQPWMREARREALNKMKG